jgi:hypothetical protein
MQAEHDDTEEKARAAIRLSRQIQAHLKGVDPGISGACLADLVSIFFAGHHPALREQAVENWITTMRAMIEPSARELAEHYGSALPAAWHR